MKKHSIFKILSLVLSLALVLSMTLPGVAADAPREPAQPTEIPAGGASGTCGDHLTWTLTEDGKLTISGTGDMEDFGSSGGPWCYDYWLDIMTVEIASGVTSISERAFHGCDLITQITIPASVTRIGEIAFLGCSGLTQIRVDSGNPSYKSIDGVLFDKSGETLIAFPGGKTGAYTVPSGTVQIADSAFTECRDLSSVKIPSTVKRIGEKAFACCERLASVTFADGVESIGKLAFQSCRGLTSVSIPESVTSIGPSAFNGCSHLTQIRVDAGNPNYKSVDGVLFDKSGQTLLEYPLGREGAYTVPDGVRRIEGDAFDHCDKITSVKFPSGLTSIGKYAFYNCNRLTSLTFPDSLTTIENDAFDYCFSLKTVTFGSGIKTIGDWAFGDCSELTDVYYPGTKTKWKAITIGQGNDELLNANIHYESTGPAFARGDMNEDDLLTTDDAICLLRHVLQPGKYPISQSGDVNGDGQITTDDAIYLLRHILQPDKYPLR